MNLILNNTRKFNSYALALDTTFKQKYATRVLLGDNGQYWVPANRREESILIKAGYEVAPK